MKFKLLFIFTLFFSSLPLCAMDQKKLDEKLAEVVKAGNTKKVEAYLIDGANPDIRIDFYCRRPTPLMVAAQGHTGLVKLLLDHHANVNARDKKDWTPLMYAAKKGSLRIIKLLLEYNADVNAIDKNGQTPLIKASKHGYTKIVKLLIDYGAQVNTADSKKKTALLFASKKDYATIVNILLKNGAHIDEDGSALKCACDEKNIITVKFLLSHINRILDKTDDLKICHQLDQCIFNILTTIEREWRYFFRIQTINAFRLSLHHADKLPLSRKKLISLTAKVHRGSFDGKFSFRKTVEHIRKNAF